MATFVVCTRCGKVLEVDVADQLPEGWRRSLADLVCPHCSVTKDDVFGDVLEEEVIYPPGDRVIDDTFDEGYCEICDGPCQGH